MSGYELVDSGGQRKLERFGDHVLVRPCSQAVWSPQKPDAWRGAHATFVRGASGTGRWRNEGRIPQEWCIEYAETQWNVAPNEFGNLGIFPEQRTCWSWIEERTPRAAEVINLFGYTGGSTLAAARAGARVCHVDASKAVVRTARNNAEASGLADAPIRWITEDALRFVEREIRRGNRYHGVILDPPTYGRGPKGEVWKIDDGILALMERCGELLADDSAYLLLTSHSPGYTPLALRNLIASSARGAIDCGEMVIEDRSGRPLPNGAYARWSRGG